ncbi:uncharacterized protein LOC142349652 isoform X2 [Convolutriloba macropyga]|uniref:uncharacterized protein LOC142349652 isoform X2 n=1 Tax=Convolutriloba macropyga TaxID=536237 RepID=UPI003F524635
MPSWSLPKIKSKSCPKLSQQANGEKSEKLSSRTAKLGENFYPDNLYKVIADFKQKHNIKTDLDLTLDDNLSDPSELTLANGSHDYTGKDHLPLSAGRNLTKTDSLPRELRVNQSWVSHSHEPILRTQKLPKNPLKKVTYALEPFPRLSAQTVRCKTCCERLHLPNNKNNNSSPSRSSGSSYGGSPTIRKSTRKSVCDRDGKFARRSYKISHFDDTYSSNEMKRSKVSTPSTYITIVKDAKGHIIHTPKWRY